MSSGIGGQPGPLNRRWILDLGQRNALLNGLLFIAFAVLLTGLLTTITLGRIFALAFWRNRADEPASMVPGEPMNWSAYMPVLILTAAVVAIGFYPLGVPLFYFLLLLAVVAIHGLLQQAAVEL